MKALSLIHLNFKVLDKGYFLNRGIFPTEGTLYQVSLQSTVPGSTLNYYRLDIRSSITNLYLVILFLKLQVELATLVLWNAKIPPYFENFYAGGPYSVKGYETNSLGPEITPVPCYEYDSENDYCPPLLDSNFDGIPEAFMYN